MCHHRLRRKQCTWTKPFPKPVINHKQMDLISFLTRNMFLIVFRIRPLQLCDNWCMWCGYTCGWSGGLFNRIRVARFGMWLKLDVKSKGSFRRHRSLWYDLSITFMGIFGWHKRETLCFDSNTVRGFFCDTHLLICPEFLPFHRAAIFKWIFVSKSLHNWRCLRLFLINALNFFSNQHISIHRKYDSIFKWISYQ